MAPSNLYNVEQHTRISCEKENMLEITENIAIPTDEIQLDFTTSSGPGGQNVNKVATAVQLRFDVRHSPSLPQEVRLRLEKLAGSRLTKDGVLVVDAHQFRTQERNRRDALHRLAELVRQAAQKPKRRRKTKPSAASKQRRLESKRRHGRIKELRKRVRHPRD
jgi:ribosome-associated protein